MESFGDKVLKKTNMKRNSVVCGMDAQLKCCSDSQFLLSLSLLLFFFDFLIRPQCQFTITSILSPTISLTLSHFEIFHYAPLRLLEKIENVDRSVQERYA